MSEEKNNKSPEYQYHQMHKQLSTAGTGWTVRRFKIQQNKKLPETGCHLH